MKRLFPVLALAALLGSPVRAGECPAPEVDEALRAELMARVHDAPDERSARIATNALWEFWTVAPDAQAQELLDTGIERRAMFDLGNALRALDALVAYCPDYAEGYNQRAFVLFLRQDYAAALADLDEALARNPEHLGALSGRAMALMALGRDAEALEELEAALALNPWLPERGLLPALEQRVGQRDL